MKNIIIMVGSVETMQESNIFKYIPPNKTLFTLPVSKATPEKTFSCLKKLKHIYIEQ